MWQLKYHPTYGFTLWVFCEAIFLLHGLQMRIMPSYYYTRISLCVVGVISKLFLFCLPITIYLLLLFCQLNVEYCTVFMCVCVCNFIISWNLEVDHPVLFLACFCFFFIIAEYTPVCIVSQCLPMLWSQRTKEENVFSFMFSFGFGEISAPIL